MADISKRNISGKVAGFRNFSPDSAERLHSYMRDSAELAKDIRKFGGQSTVPADIAAMRKVVQMGKGKYQPPPPTPETMHVTPQQY
jgi:hypothetical protein